MTFDQLQIRAATAIDMASAHGHPLNAAQRDTLLYLLVASKQPFVRGALGRMKASDRKSHERLMRKLRDLCATGSPDILGYLYRKSLAWLEFFRAQDRPLLKRDRIAWQPLLDEWAAPAVAYALRQLSPDEIEPYHHTFTHLREAIDPDEVSERIPALQRSRPSLEAELHDGNFALDTPAFFGVSPKRMTAREANERVEMIVKLCKDVAMLAQELSLVRQKDRPDAARMVKQAKLMVKRGREFVKKCRQRPEIPPERSIEEVLKDMETMNELMKPTEGDEAAS